MGKKKQGYDYRLERFSENDLATLHLMIATCMRMLPAKVESHEDVYQCKGWLRPFLLGYEGLLWGRWNYWGELKLAGTAKSDQPIPEIHFLGVPAAEPHKMLMECASYGIMEGNSVHHFLEWLLWGLGDPSIDSIDHIKKKVNRYWYERFDLFQVLDQPTDYLSHLLADVESKHSKSLRGYFPTPFHVCLMMARMVSDPENEEIKYQTVNDPCVGAGALLLAASNYHLRGSGVDINATAILATKVQCHWYAPWYIDPQPQLFEFLEEEANPLLNLQDWLEELPLF